MLENKGSKIEFEGMGRRIRNWRKDQDMKGYDLARKLKISGGSLSEIENGKSLPSALTLVSLHQNTDLDVGYVLTGQVTSKKAVNEVPRVLVVEVDGDVDHVILKQKKKCLKKFAAMPRKAFWPQLGNIPPTPFRA